MIIGYARESTLSPTQDQALAWQVQRLNAEGCDRVFIDRMSGASEKRPAYREMIELVKSGNVTQVIVCSLTRLGRSLRQVQDAIDLFVEMKVKLTSLDGSVDLTSAAGRANIQLQAVFAQLERELIRERIKAGYEGMKANRTPIRAPFGYKIVDRCLEIDENVEAIARWMRQSVIDVGLTKTTQEINQQYPDLAKIPRTPGGIKSWLQCETIYGHLWYDRHSRNGEPAIFYDNHPALFTQQERLEVEASLQFRQKHHGFKSDPIRFPFTGLIYCADCNSSMSVSYKHDRVNPVIYYRCYKGLRRSCPNKTYTSVAKIEKAMITALVAKAAEIANRASQEQDQLENPKLLELRSQLNSLIKLPQNPHIESAIAGIEADIATIEALGFRKQVTLQPEREKALRACCDLDFWLKLKPEKKHSIYRLLVKKIRCKDREVESVELWF